MSLPIPDWFESINPFDDDEEDKKKKKYIVPQATIAQGNLQYEHERAKNLVPSPTLERSWEDRTVRLAGAGTPAAGDVMRNLGHELSDTKVQKDDAWWKKALGALDTALVPLDVPMELIAELALDPISMATGSQMSALRGEAEREQFEGWKALFGGDAGEEHTGVGEVWQRMRLVREAREKRPLKMQLAMMGAEIAATLGAGAVARGSAAATARAAAMGREVPLAERMTRKAAQYALRSADPADAVMGIMGRGANVGIKTFKKNATRGNPNNAAEYADIGTESRDIMGEVGVQAPIRAGAAGVRGELEAAIDLDVAARLEGKVLSGSIYGNRNIAPDANLANFQNQFTGGVLPGGYTEGGLSPVSQQRNNWNVQAKNLAEVSEDTTLPIAERVVAAKHLAQIQLQLSTASRPGAIQDVTFESLEKFVSKEKNGRLRMRLEIKEAPKKAKKVAEDAEEGIEAQIADMAEDAVTIAEDGRKSAVLAAIDYDAYFAVDNYLTLAKQAKGEGLQSVAEGGAVTNIPAAKLTGRAFDEKQTDVLRIINREGEEIPLADAHKVWRQGYDIRGQRVTEELHKGVPLEHIAQLLGHKEIKTTRGYVKDWVKDNSDFINSVKNRNAELNKRLQDPDYRKGMDEALAAADRNRSAARARGDEELAKRAKGKEVGLANYQNFVFEVGETYRGIFFDAQDGLTDIGVQFINKVEYNKWLESLDANDIVGAESLRGKVRQLLELDAIRKYAHAGAVEKAEITNQLDGIMAGSRVSKDSIAKILANDAANGGTWKTEEGSGILRQAKILTYKVDEGKGATDKWEINVLDSANNRKARERFAEKAGLNIDAGDIDGWKRWAEGHTKLYDELDATIRPVGEEWESILNGHKTALKDVLHIDATVEDALQFYVETNSMEAISKYRQHLHDVTVEGGHIPDEFSELVRNLEEVGAGSMKKRLNDVGAIYGRAYQQARVGMLRDVESNKIFDEFMPGDETAGFRFEYDNVDNAVFEGKVAEWAQDKDIKKILRLHRLTRGMSAASIEKKIYQMAKERPRLFGENFLPLSNVGKGGKGLARTVEAQDFLDSIAGAIYKNQSELLGENLKDFDAFFMPDVNRITRKRKVQLREGADNIVSVDGVSSRALAGNIQNIDNTTENINRGRAAQKVNEFWNKSIVLKRVKPFIEPVVAAMAGGRALIAKHITKGISARAHNYDKARALATRASKTVQTHMVKNLGLKADEIFDEVAINKGVKQGHEFFTGAQQMIRPTDEIIAMENRLEPEDRLFDRLRKKSNSNPDGTLGTDSTEAARFLTQVDVMLDELTPKQWDKYFDFTKSYTVNGKTFAGEDMRQSLMFVKGIIDEMDEIANMRGVNVGQKLKDKGVTYLENYFPRLKAQTKDEMASKRKAESDGGIKNSFMGFWEERKETSIVDSLFRRQDKLGVDATYQLPVSERIGVYLESTWKEVIDHETGEWLKRQDSYLAGKPAREIYEGLEEEGKVTAAEIAESGQKRALQIRRNEINALEGALNQLAGHGGVPIKRTPDIKKQEILERSTNASIAKYGKILAEGHNNESAARLVYDTNVETVKKIIDEERVHLAKSNDEFTTLLADQDWLKTTMENFSREDQLAIKQQLEISDKFFAQFILVPARVAKPVTSLLRTAKASFDVGAGMIHGFNSLVRLPMPGRGATQKAWLESQKAMASYLLHPEYYDNWVADNVDDLNLFGEILQLGDAEPVRYMQNDKLYQRLKEGIVKLPMVGGAAEKARVAERFETGFSGMLDMLRLEDAKSLLPTLQRDLQREGIELFVENPRTGKRAFNMENDVVRSKIHEFGAVVNKMTGTYDTHLAQMTPTQSFLESNLFFFAPMYRRGTYGVLVDLFRGGMRRKEAMQQLGGVVTTGLIMANISKYAFGNEQAMDLENSGKFGKFEANGVRMGIGTAWSTVFRVATDLAVMSYQDPEAIIKPEDWTDHPVANMLMRRMGRSQMAPASSLAWDALTGRTFIGEPLRDKDDNWDMSAIAQHIGRGSLPFWLDGAFAGSMSGAIMAMPAEAMGFQAYAIQDYDKLSRGQQYALEEWDNDVVVQWRKRVKAEAAANGVEPEISWESAPRVIRDYIHDSHPEVAMMYESYRERHGEMARGESKNFYKYWQQKGQFEKQALDNFDQMARNFEMGYIDGRELLDTYSDISTFKRDANKGLLEKSYPEIALRFTELRDGKGNKDKDKEFQGDLYYDQWMETVVFNKAHRDPETGDIIWSMKNEELQNFLNKHDMQPGGENWYLSPSNPEGYLSLRKNQWMKDSPIMGEVLRMQDDMKPYWNLHQEVWADNAEISRAADRYLEMPKYMQSKMRKEGYLDMDSMERIPAGVFNMIEKRLAVEKKKLRRNNPTLDWHLVKYFNAAPSTPYARTMQRQWQSTQQFNAQTQYGEGSMMRTAQGAWDEGSQSMTTYSVAPSGQVRLRDDNRRLTGTY